MKRNPMATNWHIDAVFYELYLRAFFDANNDGHGDFDGLRQKLDYLQWLGVDVVWLLPTYPSPLRDDGYDIASYYGIHQQYGLMEDFKMAVEEIHNRGMKVITDLVLNHTSDEHPWFKEARRSKDSPLRDWYVWTDDPGKYSDARIIFTDTERSNWAYDEGSEQYYWHRFYSSQPDLNYDNPRVRDEMIKVLHYWLEMGIEGFRADAVPYLYEREGTSSENLPETHTYLKQIRAYMDTHFPGTILLGEANQWPHDLLPYFANGDEFQMAFHFPVMPRLYKAVAIADRTDVVNILADTPPIPSNCQWATFLRNHDELTLEMVTEEDRQFMWDHYAPEPRQRLNMGIRRRLAPLMENDRRRIELMFSLLFTMPGAPVLYYGDEIGMGDNVNLFDRNGVRTPMQWDSSFNAGFSSTMPDNLYAPVIDDDEYGYQTVNVAAQMDDPNSLLYTVRHMVHVRKTQGMLPRGTMEWMDAHAASSLSFWRQSEAGRMAALHNLSAVPLTVTLPEANYYNALNVEEKSTGGEVVLEPYAYHWFIVGS
ncbi:MAG: maltose alpha-D-glucosyltransferase [Chloroflexota bacterium]